MAHRGHSARYPWASSDWHTSLDSTHSSRRQGELRAKQLLNRLSTPIRQAHGAAAGAVVELLPIDAQNGTDGGHEIGCLYGAILDRAADLVRAADHLPALDAAAHQH